MTACWRSIPCLITELKLDITLACGQSFRWRETSEGEWTSVLEGRVWSLKQDKENLYYRVHGTLPAKGSTQESNESDCSCFEKSRDTEASGLQYDVGDRIIAEKSPKSFKTGVKRSIKEVVAINHKETTPGRLVKLSEESLRPTHTCTCLAEQSSYKHKKEKGILRDYFQLDVNLSELYSKWSKADTNFKSVAAHFTGVRMLRQNPVENLFSFICSSNNNIGRISGMVENLCKLYGNSLQIQAEETYYTFPEVDKLAGEGVEEKLRECGFGYRARYISATAQYIEKHHDADWLHSLRQKPYLEVKSELMKLTGVGAKVADCVCLMSLDKHGAVPVDTHVWQFARRDYMPSLGKQNKSLTERTYNEIGEFFRGLWGDYAGWAHSVLFSAELPHFQQSSRGKTASTLKVEDEVTKKRQKTKSKRPKTARKTC